MQVLAFLKNISADQHQRIARHTKLSRLRRAIANSLPASTDNGRYWVEHVAEIGTQLLRSFVIDIWKVGLYHQIKLFGQISQLVIGGKRAGVRLALKLLNEQLHPLGSGCSG